MDAMVTDVYNEEDRKASTRKFSVLSEYVTEQGYVEFGTQERLTILLELERSEDLEQARDAYLDLKQQTVAYYLSTEEIGEKYLNYLPIPGDYEPCIQLSDVGGKAWAI